VRSITAPVFHGKIFHISNLDNVIKNSKQFWKIIEIIALEYNYRLLKYFVRNYQ